MTLQELDDLEITYKSGKYLAILYIETAISSYIGEFFFGKISEKRGLLAQLQSKISFVRLLPEVNFAVEAGDSRLYTRLTRT